MLRNSSSKQIQRTFLSWLIWVVLLKHGSKRFIQSIANWYRHFNHTTLHVAYTLSFILVTENIPKMESRTWYTNCISSFFVRKQFWVVVIAMKIMVNPMNLSNLWNKRKANEYKLLITNHVSNNYAVESVNHKSTIALEPFRIQSGGLHNPEK